MASILTVGRGILAMLQPLTGARATGSVMFKPISGATELLLAHTFLSPVLNGQYRPDLAFKIPYNEAVGAGPDGSYVIAAAGTAVPVISNIGGKRHNVPVSTPFRIEPDAGSNVQGTGIATAAFTGGTDAFDSTDIEVNDLALANAVLYETFGSSDSIEQFNANVGGRWPLVILFWEGDEPADGFANNNTSAPTKRGSHAMQYAQDFELWLVCSRVDSEAQRRGQAMRLLDAISLELYDRMAVDGLVISSPGGIKIKRRARETGNGEDFYKNFRVYSMSLGATVTQEKKILVSPSTLVRFKTDYLKEDHVDEGSSGTDVPMLHDILVPNIG